MAEPAQKLLYDGLRVLDVGSFLAGPSAATILGDLGADVIKVESLVEGDPQRRLGRAPSIPDHEVNYCWELISRNKRSLSLNLKSAQGRAILDRLLASADVMVTNFTTKSRAELRLSFEDVSAQNKRLIYASMTAFGEAGPDADQPGFDSTSYFARSGQFDAMTREAEAPPFALPAQGDQIAALALYGAIASALYHRAMTGQGGWVGTSLLACGLWSNALLTQGALLGAFVPPRPPRHRPQSALANAYRTKDGRWFQITLVQEDKSWPSLCRAICRPDLGADPRFATSSNRKVHSEALTSELDAAFVQRPLSHWLEVLRRHGVPFGAISRMQDVVEDEQIRAAGLVRPTVNPAMPLTVDNPVSLGFSTRRAAGSAPALGEHTDAILSEAGYQPGEIARLRSAGVVA